MALLGAVAYNPANGGNAVTKSMTASINPTAIDTTNARITFTVPASGRVVVRIECVAYMGSVASPSVDFGFAVMNGATVTANAKPKLFVTDTGTYRKAEAVFSVSGLTPAASLTWDAAYYVGQGAASTSLQYGGNTYNVSAAAQGPLCFEIYG